ncbi:TPA: hypothetical protein QDA98_000763 [Burkholderia vietnamiensis]|nr:hypothetical protein [Burkholderia vietnamiensis]
MDSSNVIPIARAKGARQRARASGAEKRVAILNSMFDAAILVARRPSEADDQAFDTAVANAIVAAIEGARTAVSKAHSDR